MLAKVIERAGIVSLVCNVIMWWKLKWQSRGRRAENIHGCPTVDFGQIQTLPKRESMLMVGCSNKELCFSKKCAVHEPRRSLVSLHIHNSLFSTIINSAYQSFLIYFNKGPKWLLERSLIFPNMVFPTENNYSFLMRIKTTSYRNFLTREDCLFR